MRPLGHDVRVGTMGGERADEGEGPPEGRINVKTEVVVGSEMRVEYMDRLF